MTHDELLDRLRNMAHWCGRIEDHEALDAVTNLIAENKRLAKQIEAAGDIIKWYLENDETNTGDTPMPERGGRTWDEINSYWIEGNRRAERFLEDSAK